MCQSSRRSRGRNEMVGERIRAAALRRAGNRPRHVGGFTLLELAVVLVILGTLGMMVSSAFSGAIDSRERERAQADAEAARQAVRAYVRSEKRLPCPDTNGDGREDGIGAACPAGTDLGWLPHASLGLAPPEPRARLRYGVYRRSVDLVAPGEDHTDGQDLEGNGGLVVALRAAMKTALDKNGPYLTGDNGRYGAENCANSAVANPAFVLIAPVADRDSDGNPFDGVNKTLADCIAAPSRAIGVDYDDVVLAESPDTLLGWFSARLR